MDGDGDIDVLSASVDDKIAWYRNDGTGTFGTQQTITTLADGATSVYAADLDGDGDIDVLSASSCDDTIAWYRNDGSGSFAERSRSSRRWPIRSIRLRSRRGRRRRHRRAVGVLRRRQDRLVQGRRQRDFDRSRSSRTLANGAQSVYAADVDGDGDIDVLSASFDDDKIAWYKGDGSGGFGPQQIITDQADGARSVYAADLDGDGDIDVLSASLNDNKIAWYEQEGVLPVELTAFAAQQDGDRALLTWQTASETNNAGFSVEHQAPDASDFARADFVEGAGTVLEARSYSLAITGLLPGIHRFRLRQTDLDGTEELSSVVELAVEMTEDYLFAAPRPNPSRSSATISLAVRVAQRVDVSVYDALGRRVLTAFSGSLEASKTETVRVDSDRLPAGLYFVRAEGETFVATQTLTFVR